jgi:hypothetical protein
MTNKYVKQCFPFLTIKEMQTKTTLRFHLMVVRLAVIKLTATNADKDEGGPHAILVGV